MSAEPMLYVGWLRRHRGPWERICEASGERACWDLLLQTPRFGECAMTVLKRDERPEQLRRGRTKEAGGSR